MKTWIHKPTGKRYPEHGHASLFLEKKPGKWEYFIRGAGWQKLKLKEWQQEEIEDLPEGFTVEQFIGHANKYGTDCSQEFLPCCDLIKGAWASIYMQLPPKEDRDWFRSLFGAEVFQFKSAFLGVVGVFRFDIIEFEKHLTENFEYPRHLDDQSMAWFMGQKFGKDNVARFRRLFLEPKEGKTP